MAPAKIVDEKGEKVSLEDGPPDYSVQAPPQELPPNLSERLANLRLDVLRGVSIRSYLDKGKRS
jgi:hypothetical protein